MLEQLTAQLGRRLALAPGDIAPALAALADETLPAESKAAFLTALAAKGETAEEIYGFAAGLRERAVPVPVAAESRAGGVLDVVGTGGDRLGTINLSTAAALVAAAAGVPVAKHGNRAITSQAGSADVLAALGVPIELPPDVAARVLRERGFVFLLAPRYHPVFRAIAPARKLCAERGQRTLFNLLGPLLNPARPDFQLLGVPAPEWCEPFARVLQRLGVRRGLVVCGEAGVRADGRPVCLDEISSLGETTLAGFHETGPVRVSRLNPREFPLQAARLADLQGGESARNAACLRAVFSGEDRGPKRDAVLLNAAGALYVAGRAASLYDGWVEAAALLEGGAVARKLAELTAP
jgi:anthranilate phosphoribosyltransferase